MTTLSAAVRERADAWLPAGMTRGQLVTVAAVALICLQLALRGWVVSGAWFYADDFVFLADVARGDASSVRWLFEPHDSQFMPLGMLLARLTGGAGTFVWGVAAAETLVMQALASVSCWWMLRRLFGDRPMILLPLSFYLFAAFTVPAITWWAVALNQLPLQVAFFGVVTTHVRFVRTGRPAALAAAAAFLLLGYSAYVKTLLIPPILFLLTIGYFASGPVRHRVVSGLRIHWRAWLVYGTVSAAYLAWYILNVPSPVDYNADVDYAGLLDTLVYRSVGPGMVGGPWDWDVINPPLSFAATPSWAVTVAWLVLAASVLALVRSGVRLGPVCAILAYYLAATIVLLAKGRATVLGSFVGQEFRYLADAAVVFTLCVGLVLMPVLGSPVVAPAALHAAGRRVDPSSWLVAAIGLVVAGAVWSTVSYALPWHRDFAPRLFTVNAEHELETVEGRRVLDVPVSQSVMLATAFPYNLPSRLLAPSGIRPHLTDRATDPLSFNGVGILTRAAIHDGTRSRPGTDDGCGYRVGPTVTTVPLEHDTLAFPAFISVNYLGSHEGRLRIRAGTEQIDVPVESGLHSVFAPTNGGYASVDVATRGGHDTVCIDVIRVGNPTASAFVMDSGS